MNEGSTFNTALFMERIEELSDLASIETDQRFIIDLYNSGLALIERIRAAIPINTTGFDPRVEEERLKYDRFIFSIYVGCVMDIINVITNEYGTSMLRIMPSSCNEGVPCMRQFDSFDALRVRSNADLFKASVLDFAVSLVGKIFYELNGYRFKQIYYESCDSTKLVIGIN